MPRFLISLCVFAASAAILVLEIVAGRILAPYVGVSLQTFSGIIGTILAALAVGAWVGGRVADERDPVALLGPTLIVGGVLAIASPALVYVLGPSASGESPAVILLLATVGFFLPAAVLAAVTPLAAKITLRNLDTTGSVVGSLSAIGTAGALFGTFVTGFILIAAMPSQPITWATGGILLVLGLVATVGKRAIIGTGAVFLVAVLGSAVLAAPCDVETAYSCAVIADRQVEGRESVKALILDRFVNSVVDTEDPTYLSSRYARVLVAAVQAQFPDGPTRALYVGGGGFTLPRFYQATAGSEAVVLEIDTVLPKIAVERLGLVPGPWLTILEGDARIGVRKVASTRFDLVVGDAFSGRAVPWHLTTREFVSDLVSLLTDDGLYVINVIDHPPLRFVKAELATLAAVFPHVAVIAPANYLSGERGGNFVLVGSNRDIDAASIASLVPANEFVLADADAHGWAGDAVTLTDDFAPADQLLSRP